MKISQYKGYITTGRYQQVEQVNTQQKMILVNHNACNENNSAIKIYASFSCFLLFYKQYKQYCTLQQRIKVLSLKKMGLIQVLREQKATSQLMHLWGLSIKLQVKTLVSVFVLKITFSSLSTSGRSATLAKSPFHCFFLLPK